MKLSHALWGHPRQVDMVERSDTMWSTGEGNGKPLQCSCFEIPMNSMKRQKDRTPQVGRCTKCYWRSGEITPERMKRQSQSIKNPVVDVTGDGSKVQCCKEQYCIGTWNVRSINQGILEVVKQEMARVKIDILRISEIKWTGMDEFNSDDHYIYYSGHKSLRRNGVAIIVNKRVQNAVLGCNLKNDRMISVSKANHSYNVNPSLCPNQ